MTCVDRKQNRPLRETPERSDGIHWRDVQIGKLESQTNPRRWPQGRADQEPNPIAAQRPCYGRCTCRISPPRTPTPHPRLHGTAHKGTGRHDPKNPRFRLVMTDHEGPKCQRGGRDCSQRGQWGWDEDKHCRKDGERRGPIFSQTRVRAH